jgi:sec-independent protein translocase protein TatA
MPGSIGPLEISIVLIIALVVFGPKKLPELGSSLGRGMRQFKEGLTRDHVDLEAPASEPATAPPVATPSEPTALGDQRK